MPVPERRAGSSLFGRTVETVLAERPCRVILDSSLGMDEDVQGRRPRPRITSVDRALHASSRGLNALLCLIGVAMVVSTLARGGGPLALGVVLGVRSPSSAPRGCAWAPCWCARR